MVKNVFDFFVFCLLAFISISYVKVVFIVASVSIAASYAVKENTKKCYL